MFSVNPLFNSNSSSPDFNQNQFNLIDDTKYKYYRETETESSILKTPRIKYSTQFSFEVSNIEYPENLYTLCISKYYKSIKPALCLNFQFLTYVSFDISEIPDKCFENCISLKSVKASNKLFKIGNSSFKNCSELIEIDNIETLYKIGSSAFENCKLFKQFITARIIEHDAYRNTGITELNINSDLNNLNNKIEVIDDSVFKDCINLKCVNINSVQLGNSVFRGCISLKEFKTNINYINKYTFVNTGFEVLNIPENISIINEHALSNISTLQKIIINNINIKIHYNQIIDNRIDIVININSKKSEIYKLIKFIINNQHFIFSSYGKISIYRNNSDVLTDLNELINILNLNKDLSKYIENINGLNFENNLKIFYILISQQYYIIKEEENIKQLVLRINKFGKNTNDNSNIININELDILNNNLKEKLVKLKELQDIYELYKSKLEDEIEN